MSLYSLLSSFLPLLGIVMAIWFLINIFTFSSRLETGEGNLMELFLPIFVLAIVVSIIMITNMYGI